MVANNASFFCGLGLPKTGTTWLAEYLRSHPEAFIPLIKELQVFNVRFRQDLYGWIGELMEDNFVRTSKKLSDATEKNDRLMEQQELLGQILELTRSDDKKAMLKSYRSLFSQRVTEQHRAFGEFSTTYCVLPEAGLNLLDKAFPEARYIVVLRDPVDRYWSHVKHQSRVKTQIDPLLCFEDGNEDPELEEMSDYRAVVEKIKQVIPAERLHIALYEDLFLRHDENALQTITDFLGLSYVPADLQKVVYQGSTLAMPSHLRTEAIHRFQDSYLYGAELFGLKPEDWTSQ